MFQKTVLRLLFQTVCSAPKVIFSARDKILFLCSVDINARSIVPAPALTQTAATKSGKGKNRLHGINKSIPA